MSLIGRDNERKPWSRITDTRIIRPRDELRLVGTGFIAILGVLDSHDPSAQSPPTLAELIGLQRSPLPDHHHVLVQIEGQSDVMPTGLYVGTGEPDRLLFPHISRRFLNDDEHGERLMRLHEGLRSGNHGLYFMSEQEQLSSTPAGQIYVNGQGGLLV